MKDAIKAVQKGEFVEFVDQSGSQQGQSLRSNPKGEQKVRGTIHVLVGTDEDWAGSNTKKWAHMQSVMSVSTPKRS